MEQTDRDCCSKRTGDPSSFLGGFQRQKCQDISCEGPKLGQSCHRDHVPSPQGPGTSSGGVLTLPGPQFLLLVWQPPEWWGWGRHWVSRRPLQAMGPELRGWDLPGRLLEMENVSPTALSGLEAAVSIPHPPQPLPWLGGAGSPSTRG